MIELSGFKPDIDIEVRITGLRPGEKLYEELRHTDESHEATAHPRVYRLKAHEIPMKDRTARGTAVVNLLPLQPGETIQSIIDTRDYETNRFLFFCTRNGQVKKTKFTEYDSSLRAGLIAINLRDGDELVKVIPCNEEDQIFMVSRSGMTATMPPPTPLLQGRPMR